MGASDGLSRRPRYSAHSTGKGHGLPTPAALFIVNLGVVVAPKGAPGAAVQTVPVWWVEQNVNLAAQLAFLVAAMGLLHGASADQNGRSR